LFPLFSESFFEVPPCFYAGAGLKALRKSPVHAVEPQKTAQTLKLGSAVGYFWRLKNAEKRKKLKGP
jgi:hypothetical protein